MRSHGDWSAREGQENVASTPAGRAYQDSRGDAPACPIVRDTRAPRFGERALHERGGSRREVQRDDCVDGWARSSRRSGAGTPRSRLAAEGDGGAPRRPWVTAYYAGWFWDRSPPEKVDMTAMTHFVFGRVAPGGGTLGGEPGQVVFGAGTAKDSRRVPARPEAASRTSSSREPTRPVRRRSSCSGGMGTEPGFVRLHRGPRGPRPVRAERDRVPGGPRLRRRRRRLGGLARQRRQATVADPVPARPPGGGRPGSRGTARHAAPF